MGAMREREREREREMRNIVEREKIWNYSSGDDAIGGTEVIFLYQAIISPSHYPRITLTSPAS
jgi:hypothetical protein